MYNSSKANGTHHRCYQQGKRYLPSLLHERLAVLCVLVVRQVILIINEISKACGTYHVIKWSNKRFLLWVLPIRLAMLNISVTCKPCGTDHVYK